MLLYVNYYEALAETVAHHLGSISVQSINAGLLQSLYFNIPIEAIEAIESDPSAFAARVHDYLYGSSCAHLPEYGV